MTGKLVSDRFLITIQYEDWKGTVEVRQDHRIFYGTIHVTMLPESIRQKLFKQMDELGERTSYIQFSLPVDSPLIIDRQPLNS